MSVSHWPNIVIFPIKRNNCISVVHHALYGNKCVVNFQSPLPGSVENSHLSVTIFHLLGTGAALVPVHQRHQ